MDPNVKDQLNQVPPTIHQGGRVEDAPLVPEQHVESSHPLPEVKPEVANAGVQVVQTAPQIHHRMFEENPNPKIVIPEGQEPIAIQVQNARRNLDNNPKDSLSWLGRLRIAVLEKIGAKQTEHQPA